MNWMYKEDYLAHYGVKGMKWHVHRIKKIKKPIVLSNDTDAYRYDTNNKWFEEVVAKQKYPGRSGTRMLKNDNELRVDKKPSITVIKEPNIIDKGREIVDNIFKNIGKVFLNIFENKKK